VQLPKETKDDFDTPFLESEESKCQEYIKQKEQQTKARQNQIKAVAKIL